LSQLDLTGTQAQVDELDVIKDPALKALLTKTPSDIEAWVSTNVNDLAAAKNVLGKLAKAVAILARREFTEFKP